MITVVTAHSLTDASSPKGVRMDVQDGGGGVIKIRVNPLVTSFKSWQGSANSLP